MGGDNLGLKRHQEKVSNGWLPKEPSLAYASKAPKPRWRKPVWVAFTLVAAVAIAFAAYTGVQTYIRYSNPQADVTASYFEKSLNCTTASVGDVVEVNVLVYWHGYVIPEFKREVKIVDPYLEGNFELVGGSNTYQYSGYGGGDQFKYLLKVIGDGAVSVELPNPRLYLDKVEIPLTGTSTVIDLQTAS
jgi:hypothetical protein